MSPLNGVLWAVLAISTLVAVSGVANAVIERLDVGRWETQVRPR